MKMILMIVPSKQIGRILACLILLLSYSARLTAEDHGEANTRASGSRLRATHILGFGGISNNANGHLSIQGDVLRFQKEDNSSVQIPIGSIQNLTVGEEDKQVGGVPMTLARTGTPYGGGRVIALFSHKKFDTVTLEYLDSNGGFHGAIFQLDKGQGQVLRSELQAEGAQIPRLGDETTKRSTQEIKE
jgi:hypothetical protein